MSQQEKNVKEIHYTIGVRIDRPRLLQMVQLKSSIDFEKARKPKDRDRTEFDLQEIQRCQRTQVEDKTR